MINFIYLYSFLFLIAFSLLVFLFFNFRSGKNELRTKMVLKELLENLDMELPEELKSLDHPSTDPQKFS